MMLYPAMDKLTSYVPNRYMLVNVVARRARQVTLAIHEVAEGRLEAGNANLTADEDTAE